MAAFVGFIVQSNGIHFPWDLTTSGISHADIAAAGGPAAQWDALPTASKMQARSSLLATHVRVCVCVRVAAKVPVLAACMPHRPNPRRRER